MSQLTKLKCPIVNSSVLEEMHVSNCEARACNEACCSVLREVFFNFRDKIEDIMMHAALPAEWPIEGVGGI